MQEKEAQTEKEEAQVVVFEEIDIEEKGRKIGEASGIINLYREGMVNLYGKEIKIKGKIARNEKKMKLVVKDQKKEKEQEQEKQQAKGEQQKKNEQQTEKDRQEKDKQQEKEKETEEKRQGEEKQRRKRQSKEKEPEWQPKTKQDRIEKETIDRLVTTMIKTAEEAKEKRKINTSTDSDKTLLRESPKKIKKVRITTEGGVRKVKESTNKERQDTIKKSQTDKQTKKEIKKTEKEKAIEKIYKQQKEKQTDRKTNKEQGKTKDIKKTNKETEKEMKKKERPGPKSTKGIGYMGKARKSMPKKEIKIRKEPTERGRRQTAKATAAAAWRKNKIAIKRAAREITLRLSKQRVQ